MARSKKYHGPVWQDIQEGIELRCRDGTRICITDQKDTRVITKYMADDSSEKLGSLFRLLGGHWLASREFDLIVFMSAAANFRAKWGPYWVLGTRDHEFMVSDATYRTLWSQRSRYHHLKPLCRDEGRFLFAIQHQGKRAYMQVDTTIRPYSETVLTTPAQLEFEGWHAELDYEATLATISLPWQPPSGEAN